MDRSTGERPLRASLIKGGALGLYCFSCLAMAAASLAALAVVLGISGAAVVQTPLDGFLNVWGLPMLVASVALLIWTMRRSSRVGLGSVGLGGLLTITGMVLMRPFASSAGTGDMAGMNSSGTLPGSAAAAGIGVVFWSGVALLGLGYLWAWRAARVRRSEP